MTKVIGEMPMMEVSGNPATTSQILAEGKLKKRRIPVLKISNALW